MSHNRVEMSRNTPTTLGATKKICSFILETENCAKSYFGNCPNYPNCLNPEIIGGPYFTETHKNKYIKISNKSKHSQNYLTKLHQI